MPGSGEGPSPAPSPGADSRVRPPGPDAKLPAPRPSSRNCFSEARDSPAPRAPPPKPFSPVLSHGSKVYFLALGRSSRPRYTQLDKKDPSPLGLALSATQESFRVMETFQLEGVFRHGPAHPAQPGHIGLTPRAGATGSTGSDGRDSCPEARSARLGWAALDKTQPRPPLQHDGLTKRRPHPVPAPARASLGTQQVTSRRQAASGPAAHTFGPDNCGGTRPVPRRSRRPRSKQSVLF